MESLESVGPFLSSRPLLWTLLLVGVLASIISDDLERQTYNRLTGILDRPIKIFSWVLNRARDMVWMVLFLYLANWSVTEALAALPLFMLLNPLYRFVWFLVPWHLFRMYSGATLAVAVQLLLPNAPFWGWYGEVVDRLQLLLVWVVIALIVTLFAGAAVCLLMRLIPEDKRIVDIVRQLIQEDHEPQQGVNILTSWWNSVILYAFERANRYWFAGGAMLEWLIMYPLEWIIRLIAWPIDTMLGWNRQSK